ncbi:MAG: hypothetical protein GXY18_06995 [Methanomicrobiales archaeon]|nr:hypothetical protein [Methanomicrobiales archaeon]
MPYYIAIIQKQDQYLFSGNQITFSSPIQDGSLKEWLPTICSSMNQSPGTPVGRNFPRGKQGRGRERNLLCMDGFMIRLEFASTYDRERI